MVNQPSDGVTNFPQPGANLKPSIRNSQYKEFDMAWSEALKADYPQLWRAGGNIRGNDTYKLWERWRDGDDSQTVIDWLYEREDWFARHYRDGEHLRDDEPVLSNIAGVIAQIKWGGVGVLGMPGMKKAINVVKTKLRKQERRMGNSELRKTGNYRNIEGYEVKRMPTFVKLVDEEKGVIEHFVSILGNVDDGADVIQAGAFTKTIVENGRRIRVLDNHKLDSVRRVIGKPLAIREVGRDELTPEVLRYAPAATGGLLATTQCALDTEAGRDVFNLVKGGFINEMSIGFDALQVDYQEVETKAGEKITARILKEIRLWEYSFVIWGMNNATAVVGVKRKKERDRDMETKVVARFQELPLASRDRAWDSNAAEGRVRSWAGGPDKESVDWDMYSQAFMYRDPEMAEDFGGYKLPFCDVIDGELTAIPRGIFATAAVLAGSRGGVDVPSGDRDALEALVNRYYEYMAMEFEDENLVSPLKAAIQEDTEKAKPNITVNINVPAGYKAGRAISKANMDKINAVVEQINAAVSMLMELLDQYDMDDMEEDTPDVAGAESPEKALTNDGDTEREKLSLLLQFQNLKE